MNSQPLAPPGPCTPCTPSPTSASLLLLLLLLPVLVVSAMSWSATSVKARCQPPAPAPLPAPRNPPSAATSDAVRRPLPGSRTRSDRRRASCREGGVRCVGGGGREGGRGSGLGTRGHEVLGVGGWWAAQPHSNRGEWCTKAGCGCQARRRGLWRLPCHATAHTASRPGCAPRQGTAGLSLDVAAAPPAPGGAHSRQDLVYASSLAPALHCPAVAAADPPTPPRCPLPAPRPPAVPHCHPPRPPPSRPGVRHAPAGASGSAGCGRRPPGR